MIGQARSEAMGRQANQGVKPLTNFSLRWLTVLLLLAQVPHYLHLPWWVSLLGSSITLLRLAGISRYTVFRTSPAVGGIVLISAAIVATGALWLHYGYLLGRDPCVALLFLLLSFKFLESRYDRDATLLICLSAFLLLTQYFYSQTIVSALITLPAVLVMGSVLQIVRDQSRPEPVMTALAGTARLLVLGAPIAALLFVIFPRLSSPLWQIPEDGRSQTGLGTEMDPGSISNLSLSAEVAFRVEFDGPIPDKRDLYWRGPVLSDFDGRVWRASNRYLQADLAPNTRIGPDSRTTRYSVLLEPHHRQWLFALQAPVTMPERIGADGRDTSQPMAFLMSDLQLLSRRPVTTLLAYSITSLLSDRYVERGVSPNHHLLLAGTNTRTIAFAGELRRQHPDDESYVNAVLRYFNQNPFHYTLEPPLLGHQPVDEFMFQSRQGFCEHYASAFTVMMRAAGIPSRVVTGYQGGTMNGDYMIVRQSDAHAWSEVWINNQWQRIDPVTAVAPHRVDQGVSALLDQSLPALARAAPGWIQRLQLSWDSLNHDWQRVIVNFNNNRQRQFWQRLGFGQPRPWHLALLVIAAAALWSVIALRQNLTTHRPGSQAQRYWLRYNRLLANAGLPRNPAETATAYGDRCAERLPEHRQRLFTLTRLFNTLFYHEPGPDQQKTLLNLCRMELRQLSSALRHQRKGMNKVYSTIR